MERKYTPGPWKYNKHKSFGSKGLNFTIHDNKFKNEINIALVFEDVNLTVNEVEANAKLIAASPELLEALQLILPHAEFSINSNHSDHKKAISAIKKATE